MEDNVHVHAPTISKNPGLWLHPIESILPETYSASVRAANLNKVATNLRNHLKNHRDANDQAKIIALANDLESVSWNTYKSFLNDEPPSPFSDSVIANNIHNEEESVKLAQTKKDNENPTKIRKMWIGALLDGAPDQRPPVKIISVTITDKLVTGAGSLSLPQKP